MLVPLWDTSSVDNIYIHTAQALSSRRISNMTRLLDGVEVNILGVSGSPRRGANTEALVKEALNAAEDLGGVNTEFISLAGKKLNLCNGCWRCFSEATEERICPPNGGDYVNLVLKKIWKWADGVIFGSPVYHQTMSAQMKIIFDRMTPFCPYSLSVTKAGLSGKVAGFVAVSGSPHGGVETTLLSMMMNVFDVDMIIVSRGISRPSGGYFGGCATTYPQGYEVGKIAGEERGAAVKNPTSDRWLGLKSTRSVGQRVAEVAKLVKAGYMALRSTPDIRSVGGDPIRAKKREVSKIEIDWQKYFTTHDAVLPTEMIPDEDGLTRLGTSKRALEAFLKFATDEKLALFGSLDAEKVKKAILKVMILVSDEELYKRVPQLYKPFIKSEKT